LPVDRPDSAALEQVSRHYGLALSPTEVASLRPAVDGVLRSWDVVERLYSEQGSPSADRDWKRPAEADNPLGAWYVTTSITEHERGPLAGRSVAIKDNTAVAGIPMMNGTATLEGFVPAHDATVVSRLLGAGATIAGKAVCEELCFSGGSHTSRTGPVRNPWDTTRSAGGSSSGSAALLASGAVDIATGGDQGGSIRIPAAYCGVVGHKPTHGLVPYTGAFPVELTIDHLGPMARTVADVAAALAVMAGPDGLDPRQPSDVGIPDYVAELGRGADGLRLGVVTEGFARDNSDPAVDATVRAAVETLARGGMSAEEVSIPWHLHGSPILDVIATEGPVAKMIDGSGYGMNWHGRYEPDLIDQYGDKWRSDPAAFSDLVKVVLLAGSYAVNRFHGRHYAMARELAPRLRAAYEQALNRFDVLVMPTVPIRATPLPGPDAPPQESLARGFQMDGNTAPFDVSGHPACSVPAGLADGLPVGMMIIGRRFADATVLRVAHAFEQLVGGFPAPAAAT
jgi:amidase